MAVFCLSLLFSFARLVFFFFVPSILSTQSYTTPLLFDPASSHMRTHVWLKRERKTRTHLCTFHTHLFQHIFPHVFATSQLGQLSSPDHMDYGHVSSECVWSQSTQIDEPRWANSHSAPMTTRHTATLLGQHSVAPTQGEEPLLYRSPRRLRARDLRIMRAVPTQYGRAFVTAHTMAS